MFRKGEKVIYGVRGVYEIVDIREETVLGARSLYYVLCAKGDKADSQLFIPCDNAELTSSMRKLLSREQVMDIINNISSVPAAEWTGDSKRRQEIYKEALRSGDREALIAIIKAIYINSEKRRAEGKKAYVTDENAMQKAERLVYSEFSEVLGISREQVLELIIRSNEGK